MIDTTLICNRNNLSSETLNELAVKMKEANDEQFYHFQDIIAAAADRMRDLEDDVESYKKVCYSDEALAIFQQTLDLAEKATLPLWNWQYPTRSGSLGDMYTITNRNGTMMMTSVFKQNTELVCYLVNNLIPALEHGLE